MQAPIAAQAPQSMAAMGAPALPAAWLESTGPSPASKAGALARPPRSVASNTIDRSLLMVRSLEADAGAKFRAALQ